MRACIIRVVLIVSFSVHRLLGQVVNPDAVTFIGAEGVAAEFKKDVCAVFMATYSTNQNDIKDWTPLGSGFFTEGTNSVMLAITCDHVVNMASLAKKDLFTGLDTEAGY